MKRKEREHLKEDPFAAFIESAIQKFSDLKKEILTILGIVVLIGIIVVTVLLLRSSAINKDNAIFSKALEIKNATSLTADQKIAQLSTLKQGKGISSTINFYIASLYFNKGELEKAKEILGKSKISNIEYINDEKKMIASDIFFALGKDSEGIKLLNQILFDGNSKIPKDFLLYKIAKNEIDKKNNSSAVENLKKLIEEYPDSVYVQDAMKLINSVK